MRSQDAELKGGAPRLSPGMKNGRCRKHGGCFYKKEIHGRYTLRAKDRAQKGKCFIARDEALSKEMGELQDVTKKSADKQPEGAEADIRLAMHELALTGGNKKRKANSLTPPTQ